MPSFSDFSSASLWVPSAHSRNSKSHCMACLIASMGDQITTPITDIISTLCMPNQVYLFAAGSQGHGRRAIRW
jgi:hypothetical protein